MKNKLLRCVIAAAGVACCSMCLFVTPAATLPVQAAAPEAPANPQQDIKRWYFKEENGKLWMRLWNGTQGEWEGPWIYVRDL